MALNDDQAQADGLQADDTQTAVDQVTDATESQTGTNPLAAYEAELAKALQPADESEELEQSAQDEFAEGDTEEQESDAGDGTDEGAPGNSSEESEQVQRRYRFTDSTDIAVAAIAKAKGCTLLEAAEIFAGQNPTKRAVETEEEAPQDAIETASSVSAQIKDLISQKKEKLSNLEFETAADIDEQIEELRDKRDELKATEAQEKSRAESQAEQAFHAKFADNEETAVKFYPDAAVHDSPLSRRMKELDDQARELGDPIYFSPEKPFLLAKAAARELGILMTKPGATPPAKKAATRPIHPAGGNARTTAPTAAISRLDQAIDNAKDEASYEKLLAEIGVA